MASSGVPGGEFMSSVGSWLAQNPDQAIRMGALMAPRGIRPLMTGAAGITEYGKLDQRNKDYLDAISKVEASKAPTFGQGTMGPSASDILRDKPEATPFPTGPSDEDRIRASGPRPRQGGEIGTSTFQDVMKEEEENRKDREERNKPPALPSLPALQRSQGGGALGPPPGLGSSPLTAPAVNKPMTLDDLLRLFALQRSGFGAGYGVTPFGSFGSSL